MQKSVSSKNYVMCCGKTTGEDRGVHSYQAGFALQVEEAARVKMAEMRAQLGSMMADGSFRAFLSSTSKPRGVRASAAAVEQHVSAEQRAFLDESSFHDEGVEWRVMKAQWDSSLGCIIVFYYDVAAARSAGVDEDDLHEDHEFVEHSTIAEVMEWVKDSQGGEKK